MFLYKRKTEQIKTLAPNLNKHNQNKLVGVCGARTRTGRRPYDAKTRRKCVYNFLSASQRHKVAGRTAGRSVESVRHNSRFITFRTACSRVPYGRVRFCDCTLTSVRAEAAVSLFVCVRLTCLFCCYCCILFSRSLPRPHSLHHLRVIFIKSKNEAIIVCEEIKSADDATRRMNNFYFLFLFRAIRRFRLYSQFDSAECEYTSLNARRRTDTMSGRMEHSLRHSATSRRAFGWTLCTRIEIRTRERERERGEREREGNTTTHRLAATMASLQYFFVSVFFFSAICQQSSMRTF